MNLFQSIILISLCGHIILCGLVVLSNPKRRANIGFGVLALLVLNWLASMFCISLPLSAQVSDFIVKQTSVAGAITPLGFLVIYQGIIHPELSVRQTLFRMKYWGLACLGIVFLCYSPVFLRTVSPITETEMVPSITYGWGFIVFNIYFVLLIVAMAIGFREGQKQCVGAQKEELGFLLLGGCSSLLLAITLLVLAELVDNQQISAFLPLSILVFDGFLAYGIVTQRIMCASEILQRGGVHLVMGIYLSALYVVADWSAMFLVHSVTTKMDFLVHLFAALVVAFSTIPAQNWINRFSRHLFSSAQPFDIDHALKEAEKVLQEVSSKETLLNSFSEFITDTFKTTHIALVDPNDQDTFFGSNPLPVNSALVQLISENREPYSIDTLERMRPTQLISSACAELKATETMIASGCFLHKKLTMLILIPPKKNRKIYDRREQQALQLLCNQLAVALENARLYTAVQNGKIYNDILIDSMTSGMVAINQERKITVFNQRASAITRLTQTEALQASIDILPFALVEALDNILCSGATLRDLDLSICLGDHSTVHIRLSGSAIHSHIGNQIGVLIIFSDMTLLRKMEQEIRRNDRLASIGTLSAGMAHEIRNPLVTIKTFTELLPQQYSDPEFRKTFFELVGQEARRIDTLVNRLLNFARSAPTILKLVDLHEILENSMRLVERELIKKEIQRTSALSAPSHLVMADAEQINQTFVNLFLNAIQAMNSGDSLSIKTSQLGSMIRIDVHDTGCGIPEEDQKHIFDPFFTTKEDGMGMGLAIAHGIIQEHQGSIDVESEPERGTHFIVDLPLLHAADLPAQ